MSAIPTSGARGRAGLRIAVLALGVVLTIVPEAFAWGPRRGFEGGFGGGGYGEPPPPAPSYQGGGGYGAGGSGQMYFYPTKGQSPQQQQNDKAQCYTWAVQQSGFDPANPRVPSGPPPVATAPQGGAFRGAAGGAALGAVGGAIGGNAGEGAAIGAATGALFGGMRRRRWAEQEQSQQEAYMQRQQNELNQGRANFNQAFRACMAGRGYSVGG